MGKTTTKPIEELLKLVPLVKEIPNVLQKQIVISKPLNDYKTKSIRSIVQQSKIVDEAFVNSILSYTSYNKNKWMFDSDKTSFKETKKMFMDAFLTKDSKDAQDKFFDLKVWHYIKNNFEPVDNNINIPKANKEITDYQYTSVSNYNNGQFYSKHEDQSFDIAHASIMRRKNPNGEGYILHLTYRGTEFDELWKYIKGPYLDMDAYYQNFKPLEKYIRNYVSDPKNNITELQVAGHSLGGSMVQQFLKNNPMENFPVPIKGFTFGSPGSKKNRFHKFITTAYHAVLRGIELPKDVENGDNIDPRLNEFYHNNDPIPKIGCLGYSRSGTTQNLFDTVQEEANLVKKNEEKANGKSFLKKLPVFGQMILGFKNLVKNKFLISFHDNGRYVKNIRNLMEDYFVAYPQIGGLLSENLKNLYKWSEDERKFMSITVKHKEELLEMIREEFPTYNKQAQHDVLYKIREQMLVDTVEEKELAKTRYYQGRPDNYLKKKSEEELATISRIDLDQKIKNMRYKSITNPDDINYDLKYRPV